MNYIKIKEAQTKNAVTKDIDFLIPVDAIARVGGSTTLVTITLSSLACLDPDSGAVAGYTIGGFGTGVGNEPTQAVYALMDKIAKAPSSISDYLEINGTTGLVVTPTFVS
tara:strand:+ start:377 stop:706 length:330 start_codon:yes stop_codon:yes gene_type:complete